MNARPAGAVGTVQRFQAGDTGHGGIEQKGLTAAGFTGSEIGKVYLGNWLRDLSQLPHIKIGPVHPVFELINTLAVGREPIA